MGRMSTQYECLKSPDLYAEAFGIAPPDALLGKEVWPRQPGFFIRKTQVSELAQGQFGLVPTWVKSASDAKLRSTKLAVTRYETMSTATATRETWLKGQRCIIPCLLYTSDAADE